MFYANIALLFKNISFPRLGLTSTVYCTVTICYPCTVHAQEEKNVTVLLLGFELVQSGVCYYCTAPPDVLYITGHWTLM